MSIRNRIKEEYWVTKLSEFKEILNDQDKTDLLLVWDGFKPTAMIELSYFPLATISRKEFHKKIGDLEKILQKLDLRYRLQINYPKRKKEVTHYSYIARNQKKLKEIIAADNEGNTKKRRLKVGLLLGYPKTAVKAFADGKALNLNDLPSKIYQKKELKFLNFRLSKNWPEEFEYVEQRAKAIKRMNPELYRRILGSPSRS